MSRRPEQPPVVKPSSVNLRASRVAGLVFLLFMMVAMLSGAWWVWGKDNELLPDDISASRLLDGGVTHDVSERLADMDFSSDAAQLQRGLGWLTMGDLGERVRKGCPDWLFLSDELQVHADAEFNTQARARTVVALQKALASRGIDLLVVMVPDKSRIEAAHLCSLHRPAAFDGRLSNWRDLLQAQGVHVLDLSASLAGQGQDVYYRTDTHWNEAGAGVAARAVAEWVKSSGVPMGPEMHYRVTAQPSAARPGDLVRLAGVDWLAPRLQPPGEIAQLHVYTPEPAQAAENAEDLFGDSQLPTLALIGTSYSRTSDFVPQLEQMLGASIGNFAQDGGRFGGAANAYFKSPAWKQTPPKLVIWEMNERDLQAPLTAADQIDSLP